MAKFYGAVGYAISEETRPSIHEEHIVERMYCGDEMENTRRLQEQGEVNDAVRVTMQISILSDPFAIQNFHNIRYVSYNGQRWKVDSVQVRRPRLILNLGGVYNGQTPDSGSDTTRYRR